ncbi:MAG: endolytic transglycosylase MltG [Candidatus Methylomirabilales bacterium]
MPTRLSARLRTLASVCLLLLLTAVGVRTYLLVPPGLGPAAASSVRTIVYIEPGTRVQEIAEKLREAGVLSSTWAFLALAYLQGSLKRLHAGEYEFSPGMSMREILRKLETGKVVTHQITVPEGFTVDDIASLLASERLVDAERFRTLAQDPEIARRLGISAESLEGYLFPDTYRLTRGMGEEEILRLMVSRFRQSLPADFEARTARLDLTLHAVVTLASLIEKEAQLDQERPTVSAVFHNRLRRSMPLQSDPTAVYGLPALKRRITAEDLQRKTPYNTYLRPGLPPGPIANPGLASLLAAVNPGRVNYLYFVAKNDGTHHFSRTLEEHSEAVRLYQGAAARARANGDS